MTRRNTRQRQLVLDAVRNRCDHPTADQLYQDVALVDEHVSKATVYRNLSILVEDGLVFEVETPFEKHYDLRCDNHHHVACKKCGSVCDAPAPYQAQLDQEAAQQTGYAIDSHQIVFYGLCPTCQNQ